MPHRKVSLIFLLVLGISHFAKAEDELDCNHHHGSTPEINYCAEKEAEIAEKKLNKNYKLILKKLDEKTKNELIKVQKDWLKFRKEQCSIESVPIIEGTGFSEKFANCKTRLTLNRIEDLKNISTYE